MKGKKSDPEFLSQFIQQCVLQDASTPEQIVELAEQEIQRINQQILEVEELKVRRSKLLDVVFNFQKPSKSKSEEAKLISFFEIQYPDICFYICELMKKSNCTLQQLYNPKFNLSDTNFCIKQLLEHQVIIKVGNSFLRGEAFERYLKFILREV
jgi:hypothetical protein